MYLNYFNMKKEPFNITPDPGLLFLSPSHKEALAAVISGVNRRKGFVAIIGEVGVGKTTIIRSFLERISSLGSTDKDSIRTIYIFNANISFQTLLKTIFQNIGCVPQSDETWSMVYHLHQILIDEYKAGRNVVLIIDEAQNMPIDTLENLRMLSNLESSTDKLIQVILTGQPEFEQKLNQHELRALKQRIAIKVRILPLSIAESLEYISHRLAKTLADEPDVFTSGALNKIVKEATGIPRKINILCDNCLVTSFGKQQKKVTPQVAKEIIADFSTDTHSKPGWKMPFLICSLIAVSAFWFVENKQLFMPKTVQVKTTIVPNWNADEKIPAQQVQVTHLQNIKKNQLEQVIKEKPLADNVQDHSVVNKGDTLAGIITQRYGSVDKKLLNLVVKNNPQIADVNKILEGEKIHFPKMSAPVAGEATP